MEDFLAFMLWLLVEVVLIQTGRAVVWFLSFGRWRTEAFQEKESRIYAAAGALSFHRNGQRVFTATGVLFVGVAFYVLLVVALLAYAAQV